MTLSDVAANILTLTSRLLDFFVTGYTTTPTGNLLAGAIADIIKNVANLSAILSTILRT